VSVAVEHLLLALGYPVERAGVVLDVAGHGMLVADACSGLNSIYSLFALGLLYTHVTGRPSAARTALTMAAIVPIAVVANILRVLVLVLVTVHMGEEAAQGFLHGFAGMLVFVTALALLIAFDAFASRAIRGQSPISPAETIRGVVPQGSARAPGPGVVLAAAAALAMALTALAVPSMKPVPAPGPADLERIVPAAFGDWRIDPEVVQVAPAPDVQSKLDRIYRQIVSRTYVNSRGERMMLTVAHGGDQSDALKAHRQEVCYAAQGFEIRDLHHARVSVVGRDIPVTRMLAVRGERFEPVTYWFTMGDRVVLGRAERLRVQVENGLAGRVPDGLLVRVSSLSPDAPAAWAAQQSFVSAVMAAIAPGEAARFVGSARG
ncbi:MAG TPA: EpsI family protein, partial [Usitatibacter sp.]|nr:EpsI family protein [Usitatibacter sp.]